MVGIGGGEVGDAVVAEGEGKAGVDDVAEAGGGLRGPIPEWFSDLRLVIAEFPGGIGAEGITEGGGRPGGLGHIENGGIAELHVKLQQHEAAEQEALSGDLFLKEAAGGSVMR